MLFLLQKPLCLPFKSAYRRNECFSIRSIISPIHFFRPKYERIDVNVQIAKGQDYTNFIAEAIKTAVEQYLESLGIGNAVTVTGTLAAISSVITNAARPAYFLKGIKIGSHGKNLGAADVEVSFDAIAQAGDILVEVV